MNYLKAALAGFGISFIDHGLCSIDKASDKYYRLKYIEETWKSNYKNNNDQAVNIKYDYKVDHTNGIYIHNFKCFQHEKYAKDKKISFPKASEDTCFIKHSMSSISTALLGALFHDKVGRDLTPKINSYFDSEISPYLVTGGVFGILGTVGMVAALSLKNLYADPTQPWIYSLSIIKGFVIGAAAMAGAYFGDETPLNTAVESESTIELDLENVDQQIDI